MTRLAKLSAAFALLSLPLLASCEFQYGQSIPEFSAPVVDSADIIDAATEQRLNTLLEDFHQVKGPQIAVLAVKSTGGQSIEDFSIDVAREWAIGDAKRDDGVLLTIAYDDHELRIETGSGIEGELTDVQTAGVIEKMKPALRQGDPSRAASIGVEGIITELTGTATSGVTPGDVVGVGPGTDSGVTATSSTGDGSTQNSWPMFAVFVLFIALSIISALLRGDRRIGGSTWWGTGGGFSGGGGGFGGFSGGGGFGGFSGGGGGGFSGGGSSGSW